MPYATDDILETLRSAREQAGLTQRDLSARIGVPQSHISKIENGGADLRLSSLVELARALDHEVVLVPRKSLPAVEAIVGNRSATHSKETLQRSTVLNRARTIAAKLTDAHSDVADIKRLGQTVRELSNFKINTTDLAKVRVVMDELNKRASGGVTSAELEHALRQLRNIRNRIAQAAPDEPRPAYMIDTDDDDA